MFRKCFTIINEKNEPVYTEAGLDGCFIKCVSLWQVMTFEENDPDLKRIIEMSKKYHNPNDPLRPIVKAAKFNFSLLEN